MSTARERLQKKLKKREDVKIQLQREQDDNIKEEFSYLLSLICFDHLSIDDTVEKRRQAIENGENIDKGCPSIYDTENILHVLNQNYDIYTGYVHGLQLKMEENYEDCIIKSNFLVSVSEGCDRNETIKDIKKKFDQTNTKFSFESLVESSSEFVMSIFNGDKDKFKWFFDIVTKVENYKKIKITASCFVCGVTEHLNYCSCKEIAYCSLQCQRQDWPIHKTTCRFYFKEECKKEFDYIMSQPITKLVFSKKEIAKLNQFEKDTLNEINSIVESILKTDPIDLNNKGIFVLAIKCREFFHFVKQKNKSNFSKFGGSLGIYENSENATKELNKLHILSV
jgi:hypothetical protein